MNLADAERLRLEEQTRIDAGKTIVERRSMGQFATPAELARDIARETASFLNGREAVEMLEPSAGTGSFLSAFFMNPECHVSGAMAVEMDPAFHEAQKSIWSGFPVESVLADFTTLEPTRRFELVVANPPYVRHHGLDGETKKRLQGRVLKETGLRISGLAGLYCHFLLLSLKWMEPDAIGVWLVPTEWMSVNYGSALRSFLSERVRLLRIHRFASEDVRFSDALVSSCVVWFRNAAPEKSVRFTTGADMGNPDETEIVPVECLRTSEKWPPRIVGTSPDKPKVGDYFVIRRGIATGDNPFFVLPEKTAVERGLPREFLKPILPSPRHLKTDVVVADESGVPTNAQRLFLLDCTGNSFDDLSHSVQSYLKTGLDTVARKKLCSGRANWYDQEQRQPAPILCSYMGRGDGAGAPVRFILNESTAIATNSFLMLYPKGAMRRVFSASAENRRSAWEILRSIPAAEFRRAGRCYGGGLQKMEPRELGNLRCPALSDWLRKCDGSIYREDDTGQLLLAMEPGEPYDARHSGRRLSKPLKPKKHTS